MGRKTLEIIHLSDLHIRSNPDKKSSSPSENDLYECGSRVKELIKYIDFNYPEAHIVITGDITDSGTPKSIALAKKLMNGWMREKRLTVVPGNHDCGSYGNLYYEERKNNFLKAFSRAIPSKNFPWLKIYDHVGLIGLDTNKLPKKSARGHLGKRQIEDLEKILDSRKFKKIIPIILMHHHPFINKKLTRLKDANLFFETLRRFNPNKKGLVLFGHDHKDKSRYRKKNWLFYSAPCSVYQSEAGFRFRVFKVGNDGKTSIKWDGYRPRYAGYEGVISVRCPTNGRKYKYERKDGRQVCPGCGFNVTIERGYGTHTAFVTKKCPVNGNQETLIPLEDFGLEKDLVCRVCEKGVIVECVERCTVYHEVFHKNLRKKLEVECFNTKKLIDVPKPKRKKKETYICPECKREIIVYKRNRRWRVLHELISKKKKKKNTELKFLELLPK